MKKINWGVLGTAKIAKQHVIPGIKKSKNSNLYAIASRSMSKSLEFSRKFKFSKNYGTYAELYKDKKVDVIYNYASFFFKSLDKHLAYVNFNTAIQS